MSNKGYANSSIKVSDNTLELHVVVSVNDLARKEYRPADVGDVSSIRSSVCMVREAESGKQAGKLPIAMVSVGNAWERGDVVKKLKSEERSQGISAWNVQLPIKIHHHRKDMCP